MMPGKELSKIEMGHQKTKTRNDLPNCTLSLYVGNLNPVRWMPTEDTGGMDGQIHTAGG